MKKSNSNNGIQIDKNIELVMNQRSRGAIYYYFLQCVLVILISSSVCFCFLSGLGLTVNTVLVNVFIVLSAIYFMVIFYFKSLMKYTIPITLLLFFLMAYIAQDMLTEGMSHLINPFIELYNSYFSTGVMPLLIENILSTGELEFTICYLMIIVVGFTSYTVYYAKSMMTYLIVTIPLVFLSFIVGVVPDTLPYIIYTAGTIAVFSAVIAQKYGLVSKYGNKRGKKQPLSVQIEVGRIKVEAICFSSILVLLLIIASLFPIERYQELDMRGVRVAVQDKMKEIASGDILKDTFIHDLLNRKNTTGNTGLSNGKLGRVGKLEYKNVTALKVTTTDLKDGLPCYLKGYVGETYQHNLWGKLSTEDESQLSELENSLLLTSSVENLPSVFFDIYRESPFNMYHYNVKALSVQNVSADTSVNYIPYLMQDSQVIDGGKISTATSNYSYYSFDDAQFKESLNALDSVYKNVKITVPLQMSLMNDKIKDVLSSNQRTRYEDSLYQTYLEFDTSELQCDRSYVTQTANTLPNKLSLVAADVNAYIGDIVNSADQLQAYREEERKYFQFVQQAYTKLPEDGLDRVKELVSDKVVAPTNFNGSEDNIEDIDDTTMLEKLYSQLIGKTGDSIDIAMLTKDIEDEKALQTKYYRAIEFVKSYLAENTKYTLEPGQTPSNKDFVEYFLFENKRGYCMHYATAAVVMLRAMGVPCRYVEGYVVTNDDYEKGTVAGGAYYSSYGVSEQMLDATEVEIDVKDTNAHAWVEVYLPGLGWMPIEVTAPYMSNNQIEIPPVNENPLATLKPTMKPTTKPTATPKASQSPKVTPKPTVKPSTTSTTSKDGLLSGVSPFIKRICVVLLGIILMMVVLLVSIFIRRGIIIRCREHKYKKAEGNDRLLCRYRQLERIFKKQYVLFNSSKPQKEFVKMICESYPFVEEKEVQKYIDIVMRAKFARVKINDEECEVINQFTSMFITKLLNQQTLLRRLFYMYLFVV